MGKNLLKSPWFGGLFLVIAMLAYLGISYICRAIFGEFDIEQVGATEILSYLFYGFGGGVIFCCAKDYMSETSKIRSFGAIVFIYIVMILREMGAQHWLTTHDTGVTKIRFFTNPNNPLYEKIIAATVIILVMTVFVYIVIKHAKTLFQGIFKLNPVCWTTLTLCIWTPITQVIDRFPAEYLKATGVMLAEPIRFTMKIFEEGGESLLPLLIAIAFLQYHFIYSKKEEKSD